MFPYLLVIATVVTTVTLIAVVLGASWYWLVPAYAAAAVAVVYARMQDGGR